MRFQDLLDKGITFSSKHPKLTPQDIAHFETIIQAPLPEQYRDYLLYINGGEIDCHLTDDDNGQYVAVIHWPKNNNMFDDEDFTIVEYFHDMKKILWYYNEWKAHLPEHTFVIGTNPGTTFYLIGFGPENKGKIYAWRIVESNRMEEQDVRGYAYTGFIADSFVEFILSLQPISLLDEEE